MMQHSEALNEFAAAMARAQGEMENAAKNAANPHFKSRYADLAEILNTVRPALAKHGISVVQGQAHEGGSMTVETLLVHQSGQWVRTSFTAAVAKTDPQAIGSAATYLRRYSLAAACGIAQEDDDAEGAHGRGAEGQQGQAQQHSRQAPATGEPACPKCGGAMWDNREGKKSPKAPDFKCRDKACDGAFWPGQWPPKSDDGAGDTGTGPAAASTLDAITELLHSRFITAQERAKADKAIKRGVTQTWAAQTLAWLESTIADRKDAEEEAGATN